MGNCICNRHQGLPVAEPLTQDENDRIYIVNETIPLNKYIPQPPVIDLIVVPSAPPEKMQIIPSAPPEGTNINRDKSHYYCLLFDISLNNIEFAQHTIYSDKLNKEELINWLEKIDISLEENPENKTRQTIRNFIVDRLTSM